MYSAAVEHAPAVREETVGKLLVVDEERSVREGCRELAQGLGYSTLGADGPEQCFKLLDAHPIDLVLLDVKLPGTAGLDILHEIKQRRPQLHAIVMMGMSATLEMAVKAMKSGACDVLRKPFTAEELKRVLSEQAEELKRSKALLSEGSRLTSSNGFGPLIGRSPEMDKLYRIITKAAQSSHPVLILGESGTGKELVARAIHFSGPNQNKPFIPVDCGSLVPSLIESELFGYVKGAFTGANKSKDGLLAVAEGGTVFLDEIGELPIELQAKLLRAIQEKEIRPVGSTKRIPIDVRILAATNRDLELAVSEGRFRRDLYFRLNVLTLRIPPLRQRRDDIPRLTMHFLERIAQTMGLRRELSDEALAALVAHDWPGNVRELENCLERACTMSSGPVLQVADLSSPVQQSQTHAAAVVQSGPRIVPLADLEKQAIFNAIEQVRGDKLLAAKLLGIGKTTLYRKLKEYSS